MVLEDRGLFVLWLGLATLLDQPSRRWRDSGRRRHRHRYYYRRRHRPIMDYHQPNVYYMPMYSGSSNPPLMPFAAGQPMPPVAEAGAPQDDTFQPVPYGRQVMLQPFSLPMVSSQPVLQNPYTQQPDARSGLYTVPIATAATQAPQPVIYPFVGLPAFQQPQQFVPVQSLYHQQEDERDSGHEHLASHWVDEQGHERSEVDEEEPPKPRDYDNDRRYAGIRDDDERYRQDYGESRYDGGRRFHSDRDYDEKEQEQFSRDNWEDYQRNDGDQFHGRSLYQDAEENADIRSEQPEVPPSPPTEDNNEDDDENESDAYQRELQDSKDEPPSVENDDNPPEIEQEESPPAMNMEPPDEPSVVRIPPVPHRLRMHPRFAYPNRMSVDTFTREQLIGPPLRESALPRLRDPYLRRTPIESPNGEISEMSADEARFKERMRLELQAKDTIPRGVHRNAYDGLKNVIIRLNGEPLENA
ncbi:hypothetical protein QZH41_009874, partial [Actinostola sp. cb2023]